MPDSIKVNEGNIFKEIKIDIRQFCSPLSYKDAQFLMILLTSTQKVKSESMMLTPKNRCQYQVPCWMYLYYIPSKSTYIHNISKVIHLSSIVVDWHETTKDQSKENCVYNSSVESKTLTQNRMDGIKIQLSLGPLPNLSSELLSANSVLG